MSSARVPPPSPLLPSLGCSLRPDSPSLLLASLLPIRGSPFHPGLLFFFFLLPHPAVIPRSASSSLHSSRPLSFFPSSLSITLPLIRFSHSPFNPLVITFALFPQRSLFYSLNLSLSHYVVVFAPPLFHSSSSSQHSSKPPRDYVCMSAQRCPITASVCVCACLLQTDAAFLARSDLPKTPPVFSVSLTH